MKTVFLIGGTGFIGKQLVERISQRGCEHSSFSKVEK